MYEQIINKHKINSNSGIPKYIKKMIFFELKLLFYPGKKTIKSGQFTFNHSCTHRIHTSQPHEYAFPFMHLLSAMEC